LNVVLEHLDVDPDVCFPIDPDPGPVGGDDRSCACSPESGSQVVQRLPQVAPAGGLCRLGPEQSGKVGSCDHAAIVREQDVGEQAPDPSRLETPDRLVAAPDLHAPEQADLNPAHDLIGRFMRIAWLPFLGGAPPTADGGDAGHRGALVPRSCPRPETVPTHVVRCRPVLAVVSVIPIVNP